MESRNLPLTRNEEWEITFKNSTLQQQQSFPGNFPFKVISSVQSLSCVWLFATPWTAARQAFLSITNSWSLLKLMSIESVMPSNHLILCHHLLLSPSIFPSIRVFSNESALRIRWPKYWSFSLSISSFFFFFFLFFIFKRYIIVLVLPNIFRTDFL